MSLPMRENLGPVALRGELRYDEPLAGYTSWRVGGPARRFYRPADAEDLAVFMARLDPEEPLLWLGLGSNVLIGDGGFAGTVIHTLGKLDQLRPLNGCHLLAEAGVSCAKVARLAAREGLVGAEFLAGIPGTLGGALAMNAGAWGGTTWELVSQVQTLNRQGQMQVREPGDYQIGYRQVAGPAEEFFLSAHLQLQPGDSAVATRRIKELLARRAETQPTGLPSCGSVFRNPPGDHAARLIESVGLKGLRIGGAEVSRKHANFIINTGDARAADILALIERVQAEVERAAGVRLTLECHRLGDFRS